MIRKRGQKKKQQDNTMLAEGIELKLENSAQRESRSVTLMLKGVLVYLIVMGAIGCLLSAVAVDYHWWVVHSILLCAAMFCSLLYYNTRWENIGYILLLIIMAVIGYGLRNYINSGFYAVANDMAEQASAFFDSNAMRSFGEQIANRELAVTISISYIGSVCCVLVNILISRRMQYVITIPLSMGCLFMPLYLELEPSLLYVAMLLSGLLSAYVIRGNGHYRLTESNDVYQAVKGKKQIAYVYAGRTLAAVMLMVFLVCFILIQLAGLVYPQKSFQKNVPMSPLKEKTMDTMENISLLGVMGLLNFYPNTGGLTNGTLGGVSAIRLDYNPDLNVEFTPYSYERVYLKTFTGASYLPYSNRWSRETELGQMPEEGIDTAGQLKKAYQRKEIKSAKGRMRIKNIAAAIGAYAPYYTEDDSQIIYPGETKEYTYYPKLSEQPLEWEEEEPQKRQNGMAEKEEDKRSILDMGQWLEIPEENREVIGEFCQEAQLTGTPEEIVQKLKDYYQKEIPYTIRPGATPRKEDFINYFLQKNRKGYCAHFASAATLIFRYCGIPARYVEGYAIDMDEISEEGKVLTEQSYEDYYDGYSLIGETGVVSVNVTDASAHAWVEIYDEEQGWMVAEVTPASSEEESGNDFWSMFLRLLGGGSQDNAGQSEKTEQTGAVFDEQTREVSRKTAVVLIVVFVVVVTGQWGVRKGMYALKYHRAGLNERLIMDYQRYLRKVGKKKKEVRGQMNYRMQIHWLCRQGLVSMDEQEERECVRILEQAGFSDREISREEFMYVKESLGLAKFSVT